MLIILEGAPRGGKTTLADELSQTYYDWCARRGVDAELTVLHDLGKPRHTDPFTWYEHRLTQTTQLWHSILSETDLVVIEKWYPTHHKALELTDGGMLHMELMLDTVGAVRVLVQPWDVSRISKRQDDQSPEALEAFTATHHWYEEHAAKYGYLRAMDYHKRDLIDMASSRTRLTGALTYPALSGYIGHYDPAVVFVGAERGVAWHWAGSYAFAPYDPEGSSAYLMQALYQAGLFHGIGVISTSYPSVDLVQVQLALYQPHMVALGGKADQLLKELGIVHDVINHPHTWMKHSEHNITTYAGQLREAAGGGPIRHW